MTLAELKKNNPDIIKREVLWESLAELANGAALFYVSMSAGKKPKDQRGIRWAGHILTCGMTADGGLTFIRMTAQGNPKTDAVYRQNLEPDGGAALFHTDPIPEYDSRNLEPWNHWD